MCWQVPNSSPSRGTQGLGGEAEGRPSPEPWAASPCALCLPP